jgi:aryl-alcohol dehydrogenase-like predicted oxidoreductase
VDPDAPLDETTRALDDLVRAGKVRYVGCSNLAVRHILRANGIATAQGWTPFVSLQAYYSLAGRDLEHELLPLCREEGIGVLVWSPLAGGFLTGKFRRGEEGPEGSRRTGFDFPPLDEEEAYDVVDLLDEMAGEKGATIPQLALGWLLHQEGVSSVIIGAKTMDQLEDDLGSVDVSFTDEELERIDQVCAPEALYPQWMIRFQNQR